MRCDVLRKQNIGYLKTYGDRLKFTVCRSVRSRGLDGYSTRSKAVNSEKSMNNICRAKSAIMEYALSNDWEFFVTLTIDGKKMDRFDLPSIIKSLSKWLNHYRERVSPSFRYLLVPEYHQDGAIHFHGFMIGIAPEDLHQFVIGDKMSSYIASRVRDGRPIFNWMPYALKFGFCDIEPIMDSWRASLYLTKYVKKDLCAMKDRYGLHLYYCSKGLKRSEKIAEGLFVGEGEIDFAFVNEYVRTVTVADSPENRKFLEGLLSLVDYERTRSLPRPLIETKWKKLENISLDEVNFYG